ncbi:hypothetical protein KSP40_PGU000034 [Platanthera guangdongensis]|uniref:UBZ4-type domain-containing protein n=1 Tax=Platanthera guangdongensis TaxID=2320717 RepID=A0ABR2LUC5_9ASPA
MFSLVNSSCSSSKISEHKADDRDSDLLPPKEAKPAVRFETHTTNFSIRDHVLASRSKNISASWPFPRHLLQICLKSGIHDLLPPFEPPGSTKSVHNLIKPASEKIAASSVQLEQTVLELDGSDELRLLSKLHKLDNLENDVCGVEKFSSPTGEPVVLKKCRINQKAEVISETSGEEEFISSPSMASDIMASKICPVCKSFSSTSNTTLNAHMDQCLSMDSDATFGVENFHKIKAIKPRKKRLMVDIYATAQFCTLEDLDRRNGTTWATDLNPAAQIVESNLEAKKPKLVESVDSKVVRSESAVYVDSNGIKIGILSKFNDTTDSRELFRSRNNIETVQDGNVTSSNENYSALSSNKMKFKMRNKKLRSLKQFENEVQAGTEMSHHEQSHVEEEGSLAHLSGELDKSLSCGSATLKNWPSSKRSVLPKKSGKKNFHKIFEHLNSASSDTPSSPRKIHVGEFSRVLEYDTANLSNTVQNTDKEKRSPQGLPADATPPNVILLKLSRVPGSVTSLPGSTSEDFFKGSEHKSHAPPKSHKRSAETCYLPAKTKKISTLSAPNSDSVKTGKHQSLLAWTDAQTRTSEIQFYQKMNFDTFTGASSHNADVSSIMQKSSTEEDRDSQVDTNDKTSAVMLIESMKQADKLIKDQLENRAKATSAQEFSACLTSHDELALDIPIKNLPIDLDHMLPNRGNNSSGGQEPLILLSPASSASTVSPASAEDYHSKDSENEPASNPSMTQVNWGFPYPLMVSKEGHHKMDIETNQQAEKPCCCSWQSIMAGNMKQKPLSNLHVRPNISSFNAYSNSRTDTLISPSIESPTDSILTKAFSDVGSTSPSCGTPTQSSSNSILRLMGKDLMVINNEESTQIPKVHSPNVHGLPSPFGFASYASAPNRDAFSFPVHNQSPLMIGSQDRNLLPGFHHSRNKRPFSTKEVIVINDSDEAVAPRDTVTSSRAMFQRPFSYFPTRTHLLPMDNDIRPSIPINQGGSFPASHMPSPFVFQSPSTSHLNLPFYYPQSLM